MSAQVDPDGAGAAAGDASTGDAAAGAAAVYTIRRLRANLRAVIAAVRETGAPAVIAERGERPVAVLVDYASWAAQHGGDDGTAVMAPVAGLDPGDARALLPAAEPERPPASTPPPLPAGWGGASPPQRSHTDGQAAIPAGWRVAAGGWGG